MSQTIDAVFEDGLFRPIDPLPERLLPGQHVQVVLERKPKKSAKEMLKLLTDVYEGLSPEEIDEIERIALDRSRFFTPRDQ
jgi:predicted DNA-binding antitoxin AbrB/MazE fold protein